MLHEELYFFIKSLPIPKPLTFKDVIITELDLFKKSKVSIIIHYKKREINLEYYIEGDILYIIKTIPTKNSRIQNIVETLSDEITNYLKNDSSHRLKYTFVEKTKIDQHVFNPYIEKGKEALLFITCIFVLIFWDSLYPKTKKSIKID